MSDSSIIWHDSRHESWAHVGYNKLIRICYYKPVWCWLCGGIGAVADFYGSATTRDGAKAAAMDAVMARVEA